MIINEFHVAAILVFFLFLVIWFLAYDPVISVMISIKKANKKMKREYKINGNSDFLSDEGFRLFRNRKLRSIWARYLSDLRKNGVCTDTGDISDYFGPDILIPEIFNIPLLDLMPFIFFVSGPMAGAGAYLYKAYTSAAGFSDKMWSGGIIVASAVFAMLMAIASKVAVHDARTQSISFVRWIKQNYASLPDLRSQLNEITTALQYSLQANSKLISELNEVISSSITGMMQPFLEGTSDTINSFVLAATDKQADSMSNLAVLFSERTSQIYSEQINMITSETTRMAEVQSNISSSLKEAAMSSSTASKSVENITALIREMTVRYNDNLSKLESMHVTLAASVSEFKELAQFIKTNYTNADDRIESLASSQKQILEASLRANESLHAAANDILKAGEVLRDSYSGISKDISLDVEKVFASFDENLSGISIHLSRSIQELQEAVDELPEILRRAARDI